MNLKWLGTPIFLGVAILVSTHNGHAEQVKFGNTINDTDGDNTTNEWPLIAVSIQELQGIRDGSNNSTLDEIARIRAEKICLHHKYDRLVSSTLRDANRQNMQGWGHGLLLNLDPLSTEQQLLIKEKGLIDGDNFIAPQSFFVDRINMTVSWEGTENVPGQTQVVNAANYPPRTPEEEPAPGGFWNALARVLKKGEPQPMPYYITVPVTRDVYAKTYGEIVCGKTNSD